MELFKKIYFLIYPLLSILFILILKEVVEIKEMSIAVVIGISLAYVLSPKVRVVEKQDGFEEQIKWLFFQKVINKKM